MGLFGYVTNSPDVQCIASLASYGPVYGRSIVAEGGSEPTCGQSEGWCRVGPNHTFHYWGDLCGSAVGRLDGVAEVPLR